MKFRINFRLPAFAMAALTFVLLASSCNDNNKNCEGYAGDITNADAKNLVDRCHFIHKDTIVKWVAHYENYQKVLMRQKDYQQNPKDTANAKAGEMKNAMDQMSTSFLMGGSVSYNSCIIKKILCDKNSIGLRVLYGIDDENKMHIILVGIQPDYSNLYVLGADDCCGSSNKKAAAGLTSGNGNPGGAEYGQMP